MSSFIIKQFGCGFNDFIFIIYLLLWCFFWRRNKIPYVIMITEQPLMWPQATNIHSAARYFVTMTIALLSFYLIKFHLNIYL